MKKLLRYLIRRPGMLKVHMWILAVSCVVFVNTKEHEGTQQWRVFSYNDPNCRNVVEQLKEDRKITTWLETRKYVDIVVKKPVRRLVHDIFEKLNITYKIISLNLENDIRRENPSSKRISHTQRSNGRLEIVYF